MCMSEYLPEKQPNCDRQSNHTPSSTAASACPRPSSTASRAYRSSFTFDSGAGTSKPRRQSAYPNSSHPLPPVVAHSRRRQHSVALAPRRSTLSGDRITESGYSSFHSSRHFPSSSSPSGIRHSRTEPIADQDQVALLPVVGNNVSGLFHPAGRPSAGSTDGVRLLTPFDELREPSPTSLSRRSNTSADSGSSAVPPQREGSSSRSNAEQLSSRSNAKQLSSRSNAETTLTTATSDNQPAATIVLQVSAATRADLVDIRAMLATYMKRLADKDAAAGVTKEWRIVAKVFDRLFFFLYCATILVSLSTIFPRA